ncbi:hypothetical protein FOZ60_010395 [Perkinsus olseni]|uniref:Uncharacterized protein n=1 Tax=Perkinsus olseni TaxID=32597 RepID=A0A7J6NF95_PEROL|nr:hypothetical protein FOZ60_010395 [Perkinsus olseni]
MYETAMYEWRFPGSRRWRAGAGRILLVEIGCDGSVISAGRTDDRTVRPRAREAEVVGDEEIRVLCAHGGKQGGLGGAGERSEASRSRRCSSKSTGVKLDDAAGKYFRRICRLAAQLRNVSAAMKLDP